MLILAGIGVCLLQIQFQFKKISSNGSNAAIKAWKNNCLSSFWLKFVVNNKLRIIGQAPRWLKKV